MPWEKPAKEKRRRESSSTDTEAEDGSILGALRKTQIRLELGFAKMESNLNVVKQELRVMKKTLKEMETSLENVGFIEWNELKQKNIEAQVNSLTFQKQQDGRRDQEPESSGYRLNWKTTLEGIIYDFTKGGTEKTQNKSSKDTFPGYSSS